ncbi:hypothetical protein JCM8097_006119 [Rhodosporidiobolus ruineniae]
MPDSAGRKGQRPRAEALVSSSPSSSSSPSVPSVLVPPPPHLTYTPYPFPALTSRASVDPPETGSLSAAALFPVPLLPPPPLASLLGPASTAPSAAPPASTAPPEPPMSTVDGRGAASAGHGQGQELDAERGFAHSATALGRTAGGHRGSFDAGAYGHGGAGGPGGAYGGGATASSQASMAAASSGHGQAGMQTAQQGYSNHYAYPAQAGPSSSNYAPHPLYSRQPPNNHSPVFSHAAPPPPPASAAAYSHPAYAAAGSSRPSSSSGYNAYQPYTVPSTRSSFSGPSVRPASSGAGLMGAPLPPMSLAPGPAPVLSSSSAHRHSLPSISTYYDSQAMQPQQQKQQSYYSSSSAANSNSHDPYPPPHPAYSSTYTLPGPSQPSYSNASSTALSHPAYARTSSSFSSNPSPTSGSAGPNSATSVTTAASGLSSLSAAANVVASSAHPLPPHAVPSVLKPSSSSTSVPNSPWAGPPPPTHLSLGGASLAKRRRSATDAVLGLPGSAPFGSGRRASGGLIEERREVEEGREDEGAEQNEPERPKTGTLAERRRGSDGTLLLPAFNGSASNGASASNAQQGSYPAVLSHPVYGDWAPPPPSHQQPPPQHHQHQHPPPRTVVLSNPDGSTSVIKEPRASSPLQPPPSFPQHPAYANNSQPYPSQSHPLSHSYPPLGAQQRPPPYPAQQQQQQQQQRGPHPYASLPADYAPKFGSASTAATSSGAIPHTALPPISTSFSGATGAASNSPSPASSSEAFPPSSAAAAGRRGRKRKTTAEREDEGDEGEEDGGFGDEGEEDGLAGVRREEKPKQGPPVKRFMCPHPSCGRAFARNFNLQSHIKSHNGVREFQCPEVGCHKLFSRKHDCTRHCIAIHNYDKDFLSKPNAPSLLSGLTGPPPKASSKSASPQGSPLVSARAWSPSQSQSQALHLGPPAPAPTSASASAVSSSAPRPSGLVGPAPAAAAFPHPTAPPASGAAMLLMGAAQADGELAAAAKGGEGMGGLARIAPKQV